MKIMKNEIKQILPEEIKCLIESGLPESEAYVEGDGAHFIAFVISSQFANKTLLQKQQLVNETVKSLLLDGTLHALSIKTYTPSEWEKLALNQANGDGNP